MNDNIELFDNYITGKLSDIENSDFELKLKSDSDFALDFKAYLLVVNGIYKEAQQDNLEFGHAMKKISRDELLTIIGRRKAPRILRLGYLRERMVWAASVAAVLVIGIMTVFNIQRSAKYEIDNTVFAYNYVPSTDRASGKTVDISEYDNDALKAILPKLKHQYATAPDGDIQAQQDAGMRLAMAYLKLHNRKMARQTLGELKSRFADDEIFVAQCNRILSQIK